MKVISVYGSSQPQPGQPAYRLAYNLGRELAQAGFAVATGGYIGAMTAVSQGAADVGGHVIGVTCDEIQAWRPVRPNRWITQEIRYPTLEERVAHLVTQNDGVIALPGGVGTLAEVALTWSQLQVNVMPPRPFILLGEQWRRTLDAFIDPAYVLERHRALLQFAGSPAEALEQLLVWGLESHARWMNRD